MRHRFSGYYQFMLQNFLTSRIANLLLPFVLGLFELIIFWHQAKWNPNGIHDGFMYAPAILVAEGGVPNKDAFTQYGPYVMLIQGFWLSKTNLTLLSLRHLNALFLTIIGILLYFAGGKYLSKRASVSLSVIWALSAPKLLPAVLPWPSVLSTLLALTSVSIFLAKSNLGKNLYSKLLPVFSGFLISVAIMVRIHIILLPLLLTLFYVFSPRVRGQIAKLHYWFIGFTLGLILHVFYFVITKSLNQYWDQCIAWTFNRFALNPEPWSHQRLVALLSSGIILILGLVGLLVVKIGLDRAISLCGRKQKLIRNCLYFLCFVLSVLAVARHSIDPGRSSFHNPRFVLIWVSENFLQLSIYMILILCLAHYFRVFSKRITLPQ
jgi:hypothetical protein